MPVPITLRRPSLEHVAIAALLAVTVLAVAGYATFALHPERLRGVPHAAETFGAAMRFFPPGHVLAGLFALVVVLTRRVGGAWLPAAGALYAISLASELAGTTVGLPFGPYHYGDGLGVKWFAHVPVLIPASWFMMALPSFALAGRWVAPQGAARGVGRCVAGAALLVSWDLALDPAMSRLVPFWVWERSGPYYGMPLLNLVGWYVTGLVLMIALAAIERDRWLARVPTAPLLAIYGANLALPALMAVAAGLWPAALLAAAPIAVAAGLAALRGSRRAESGDALDGSRSAA